MTCAYAGAPADAPTRPAEPVTRYSPTDEQRNRERQRATHGQPLGDVFSTLATVLRVTPFGLASVLGMTPPMMDALRTGRRAAIPNPVVDDRLTTLIRLATVTAPSALHPASHHDGDTMPAATLLAPGTSFDTSEEPAA